MRKKENKGGFVVTSELLLIVTILVIGLIVGMVTLRNAVNTELEDVAEAIGDLNQSYDFQGLLADNSSAITAGSGFQDAPDIPSGSDAVDGNSGQGDGDWTFIPSSPGLEAPVAAGAPAGP